MKQHIIDTNKQPKIPYPDWKVEEHIGMGKIKWSSDEVILHFEDEQKTKRIVGTILRERLKGKSVLNANILDYLLLHPKLIPESWKSKAVFFWGTIYRGSNGYLSVRYLYWYGARWYSYYFWLEDVWNVTYPAALLARPLPLNNSLESRVLELEKFRERVENIIKIN